VLITNTDESSVIATCASATQHIHTVVAAPTAAVYACMNTVRDTLSTIL
jgi:hypothetical protein